MSRRLQRDQPAAIAALTELSDRIDVATMRKLNARLEVSGEPVESIARSELESLGLIGGKLPPASAPAVTAQGSFASYMWEHRQTLMSALLRHILLVTVALLAGILVAIPLGLWLDYAGRAAEPVIRAIGLLQTIPSMALLAFMVPLIGIGVWPALVALWLYALYPIVRSTYSGVRDADPNAVHAARALGMTPGQILRQVRLPLAAPTLLSGIRTAAVIAGHGDTRRIHRRRRSGRADRDGTRARGHATHSFRRPAGGRTRPRRGCASGNCRACDDSGSIATRCIGEKKGESETLEKFGKEDGTTTEVIRDSSCFRDQIPV